MKPARTLRELAGSNSVSSITARRDRFEQSPLAPGGCGGPQLTGRHHRNTQMADFVGVTVLSEYIPRAFAPLPPRAHSGIHLAGFSRPACDPEPTHHMRSHLNAICDRCGLSADVAFTNSGSFMVDPPKPFRTLCAINRDAVAGDQVECPDLVNAAMAAFRSQMLRR
jgi:hypothetical protein